jgi:pimeloyl-ACP methyl ester carboxylesterase
LKRIYWSDSGEQRAKLSYRRHLANWPVRAEEFRVSTTQGETFVLASGPPDAPPLVLLHGGMSNSLSWIPNVQMWSKHFRIYAVDTIGDPGFSAPSRPPFVADTYALWLDDLWKSLALSQAKIVGWSLGGWLGLDYAMRRPQAVGALVALAPGGVVPIRLTTIAKTVSLMLLGAWGRRRAFLGSLGFTENIGADLAGFIEFSLLAQVVAKGRTRLPGLFTDEALAALAVPTMLVVGEGDAFFDAQEMRLRFKRCVPCATVHCRHGMGHGLFGITDLVLEFLLKSNTPREPGTA